MKRGFGMWIMSKLVMFIFLFSLVAALSGYYVIYQHKVIDDTAKKFTQSISEVISDALSYQTMTRVVWLDSNIWIRDTSRPYTIVIEYVDGGGGSSFNRVVIFLAWNDHNSTDNIEGFASASAVNLMKSPSGWGQVDNSKFTIGSVCLYSIESGGHISSVSVDTSDPLIIRPSAPDNDNRADYLLIYKTGHKLCIAKKNVGVDLQDGLSTLKSECGSRC